MTKRVLAALYMLHTRPGPQRHSMRHDPYAQTTVDRTKGDLWPSSHPRSPVRLRLLQLLVARVRSAEHLPRRPLVLRVHHPRSALLSLLLLLSLLSLQRRENHLLITTLEAAHHAGLLAERLCHRSRALLLLELLKLLANKLLLQLVALTHAHLRLRGKMIGVVLLDLIPSIRLLTLLTADGALADSAACRRSPVDLLMRHRRALLLARNASLTLIRAWSTDALRWTGCLHRRR